MPQNYFCVMQIRKICWHLTVGSSTSKLPAGITSFAVYGADTGVSQLKHVFALSAAHEISLFDAVLAQKR